MKHSILVLLAVSCLSFAFASCNAEVSAPEEVVTITDATQDESNDKQDNEELSYNNDLTVPFNQKSFYDFYGGTNKSCSKIGMRSRADFISGNCIKKSNGLYYSMERVIGINQNEAYSLQFSDNHKRVLCHFIIEKLLPYEDYDFKIGKTTIDDIKKFFPYEDYHYDKSESELHFDLQFLGEEKTLQFKNKNGKYILSNIYTPEPSLVVSKSILPKDLELITK